MKKDKTNTRDIGRRIDRIILQPLLDRRKYVLEQEAAISCRDAESKEIGTKRLVFQIRISSLANSR